MPHPRLQPRRRAPRRERHDRPAPVRREPLERRVQPALRAVGGPERPAVRREDAPAAAALEDGREPREEPGLGRVRVDDVGRSDERQQREQRAHVPRRRAAVGADRVQRHAVASLELRPRSATRRGQATSIANRPSEAPRRARSGTARRRRRAAATEQQARVRWSRSEGIVGVSRTTTGSREWRARKEHDPHRIPAGVLASEGADRPGHRDGDRPRLRRHEARGQAVRVDLDAVDQPAQPHERHHLLRDARRDHAGLRRRGDVAARRSRSPSSAPAGNSSQRRRADVQGHGAAEDQVARHETRRWRSDRPGGHARARRAGRRAARSGSRPQGHRDRPGRAVDDAGLPPDEADAARRRLLGLGLGIGAALLRESFSTSIETAEDLARATGVPVYAEVPDELAVLKIHDRAPCSRTGGCASSRSRCATCARTCSSPTRNLRSLIVTSPDGSHGKTTISFGLAVTLARAGTGHCSSTATCAAARRRAARDPAPSRA